MHYPNFQCPCLPVYLSALPAGRQATGRPAEGGQAGNYQFPNNIQLGIE